MSTTSFTTRAPKRAPATTAPGLRITRGVPLPFGTAIRRHGVNFAIFSSHATACTLVLFRPGETDPYVEFPLDPSANRTGQVWHVFVEGLDSDVQYGYRFGMQPNPD